MLSSAVLDIHQHLSIARVFLDGKWRLNCSVYIFCHTKVVGSLVTYMLEARVKKVNFREHTTVSCAEKYWRVELESLYLEFCRIKLTKRENKWSAAAALDPHYAVTSSLTLMQFFPLSLTLRSSCEQCNWSWPIWDNVCKQCNVIQNIIRDIKKLTEIFTNRKNLSEQFYNNVVVAHMYMHINCIA